MPSRLTRSRSGAFMRETPGSNGNTQKTDVPVLACSGKYGDGFQINLSGDKLNLSRDVFTLLNFLFEIGDSLFSVVYLFFLLLIGLIVYFF